MTSSRHPARFFEFQPDGMDKVQVGLAASQDFGGHLDRRLGPRKNSRRPRAPRQELAKADEARGEPVYHLVQASLWSRDFHRRMLGGEKAVGAGAKFQTVLAPQAVVVPLFSLRRGRGSVGPLPPERQLGSLEDSQLSQPRTRPAGLQQQVLQLADQ